MYPVEFEVVNEDIGAYAKFTAFDEESFNVKIKEQILSSDDIREVANCLDRALVLLKEGIE